ncbi:MAG: hypothetical protein ACI4IX_04875 [Acutalibacteraceae bacterium]
MKKTLSILLATIMLFSFAACSGNGTGNDTTSGTTDAPAPALSGTLEEIADKIYENATDFEISMMPATEIDLTDADAVNSYLGVASADSIERAVFSEPGISAIPYSMCLIKVKDGADKEALKQEILNGVNYRKWVCVAAEKILVADCGDVIMMVMSSESNVETIYNAFSAVCGSSASEPMTKAGETEEDIELPEEILG